MRDQFVKQPPRVLSCSRASANRPVIRRPSTRYIWESAKRNRQRIVRGSARTSPSSWVAWAAYCFQGYGELALLRGHSAQP